MNPHFRWIHCLTSFYKDVHQFWRKKSRMEAKLSLFVLRETINHVTLLTSILARQRRLKIFGNVLCWLHIFQFYRIVSLFLFWFRWYQWYFCGINGCEDTHINVCLYTYFSEGNILCITVRDVNNYIYFSLISNLWRTKIQDKTWRERC